MVEVNDYEQDGGHVGASTGLVVLAAGVEVGDVELVIDEMIQCVFEAAG